MNYYTYWTVAETASQTIKSETIILIIGLVCLVLSFYFFKFKKNINDDTTPIIKWSTFIFGIFLILLYIYSITRTTPIDRNEILILKDKNLISVVEGKVIDFKIEYQNTRGGQRTIESFVVDKIHFSYNDYPANEFNNFSKTRKNGGLITNGIQVRITYITENNRIVKIELLK